MKADVSAQVVEAFDINDKANDVYELNFGHRPYQVPPPIIEICGYLLIWPMINIFAVPFFKILY